MWRGPIYQQVNLTRMILCLCLFVSIDIIIFQIGIIEIVVAFYLFEHKVWLD